MSNAFDPNRLSELVALLCDELITDEQFDELDRLLDQSDEARKWYHVYMGMHRDLERTQVPVSRSSVGSDDSSRRRQQSWLLLSRLAMAIAAVLLVVVSGFLWIHSAKRQSIASNDFVAQITHLSEDITWETVEASHLPDDSIGAGHLRIGSGLLRLQYKHGVVLSLIGPADLQVITGEHAVLHRGQLAAYVPDGAEGFRVDTPSAGVVDLGTEFGVTVDDNGETELSVFDGQVELTSLLPNAKTSVVSSGHSFHVNNEGIARHSNSRR